MCTVRFEPWCRGKEQVPSTTRLQPQVRKKKNNSDDSCYDNSDNNNNNNNNSDDDCDNSC